MPELDGVSILIGFFVGLGTPFMVAGALLRLNRLVQEAQTNVRNDPKKPGTQD